MDAFRAVFAVIVVAAFITFGVFLVINADTGDSTEWERWVYVFGAAEAIAFAAVGWMFGKEVNRQRAESAEATAEQAQEEALKEHGKGAKLAGMVLAEGGAGQEAQEVAGGGTPPPAVEFAQQAYSD